MGRYLGRNWRRKIRRRIRVIKQWNWWGQSWCVYYRFRRGGTQKLGQNYCF